jgi:hypothetical protein
MFRLRHLSVAVLGVVLASCGADAPDTAPASKPIETPGTKLAPDESKADPAAQDAAQKAEEKAAQDAAEKAAKKAAQDAAQKDAAEKAAAQKAAAAAATAAFQATCRKKITAKMPDPSAAKISYRPLPGADGFQAEVRLQRQDDGADIRLDFTCIRNADGDIMTKLIAD